MAKESKGLLEADLGGTQTDRIVQTAASTRRPKVSSAVQAASCSACAKCGGYGAAGASCGRCASENPAVQGAIVPGETCKNWGSMETIVHVSPDGAQTVAALSIPAATPYVMPAQAPLLNPPLPDIPRPSTIPASLPTHSIVLPPSMPGATEIAASQSVVGVSYGPGVEVVSGGQSSAASVPVHNERTSGSNIMMVRFGQANNYQVVVGQVSQFRRAWKLRYTAVESDDKYGGSLTLIGNDLDNLHDGQMVRVEGVVLPSEDRASGTRYQVSRVEVLEPNVK